MSLELDDRRRAMLLEMQLRVWLPDSAARSVPPLAAAVPLGVERPRLPSAPGAGTAATAPAQPADVGGVVVPVADGGETELAALAAAIAQCGACTLCEGRKAAVFRGVGPVRQADWLVVGEPPTEEEERAGGAFAGQAGALLDNMLRAVRRTRDGSGSAGAWLTNVVKCRPATARNPRADELARCAMYLRREVALVQPRVILAMGRFAALSLLVGGDPDIADIPFARLRGQLHAFEGVPVVVTYSPARLLRAQEDKAGAWVDLCLAQATSNRLDAPQVPAS